MLLFLAFSLVSSRTAWNRDTCPDADIQQDCDDLCRVIFTRCRLLCETQSCQSDCEIEYEACFKGCPCGENCIEGCAGCDNPFCNGITSTSPDTSPSTSTTTTTTTSTATTTTSKTTTTTPTTTTTTTTTTSTTTTSTAKTTTTNTTTTTTTTTTSTTTTTTSTTTTTTTTTRTTATTTTTTKTTTTSITKTTTTSTSTTTTATSTTQTLTSTTSTTTTETSPSGDKIYKLKLNNREITEKEIFSNYQTALAAVQKGDDYKLIELEHFANGHVRGYIESLDGRRWKRGTTDLIELERGRGTIWRLTPHPEIKNTFQLHYDENYWYDINQSIRLAIHASPFVELGAAILEVTRITFSESIFMEDEQFLWTIQ